MFPHCLPEHTITFISSAAAGNKPARCISNFPLSWLMSIVIAGLKTLLP